MEITKNQLDELASINDHIADLVDQAKEKYKLTTADPIPVNVDFLVQAEIRQLNTWTVRDCFNVLYSTFRALNLIYEDWSGKTRSEGVPSYRPLHYICLVHNLSLIRMRVMIVLDDPNTHSVGMMRPIEYYRPEDFGKREVNQEAKRARLTQETTF